MTAAADSSPADSSLADSSMNSGGEAMPGPHGLLVIDKPAGMTSHDVVRRIRKAARTKRVGHAGTLDPMATGILILGLGRATRLLGHLALNDKDYTATIRLGQSTITDDAEGEITESVDAHSITDEAIACGVAELTGQILQVPSRISAIKVDGKRSYARVRAGEHVELAARPVTVSAFDVIGIRRNVPGVVDVDVAVTCSTGTYIRALARDLGEGLGVGGHLVALRRTRVGAFGFDQAQLLDDDLAVEGRVAEVMVGLDDAVAQAFEQIEVDAEQAVLVLHGRPVEFESARTWSRASGAVAVMHQGRALALMEERGGRLKSVVVFA